MNHEHHIPPAELRQQERARRARRIERKLAEKASAR